MTPKQKHIKSHLFYCLMQLLLEDLDDLKKSIAEKAEKENIYEYIYAHNKSFVDGLISQLESYFVKE